jgi:transcriptional regulator with XRE-family HTH domain
MKDIKQRLLEIKEGHNLTYKRLEELIGVDDSTLYAFLHRGRNISYEKYELIQSFIKKQDEGNR